MNHEVTFLISAHYRKIFSQKRYVYSYASPVMYMQMWTNDFAIWTAEYAFIVVKKLQRSPETQADTTFYISPKQLCPFSKHYYITRTKRT